MPMKHKGFSSLLYLKFVHMKQYKVEPIATALGISPSTLYNYIEGEAYFPPDLIGPLYNATNDPDSLNFILNDTDQMLTPRHAKKAEGEKSPEAESLDIAVACGKLIDEVRKAIADDNHISKREAEKILKACNKLPKEVEDVSNHAKKK